MFENEYNNKNREVKIYHDGRVIAAVDGAVMRRTIRGSRHILRHPRPAIAFHETVVDDAIAAGAEFIEVTDGETGKVYKCSIRDFVVRSEPIDLGHGRQLALRLGDWE